jgi:hypothetical protein
MAPAGILASDAIRSDMRSHSRADPVGRLRTTIRTGLLAPLALYDRMLDFLVAVAGTLMRRGKTYGLCPLTPEETALVLQAFGI